MKSKQVYATLIAMMLVMPITYAATQQTPVSSGVNEPIGSGVVSPAQPETTGKTVPLTDVEQTAVIGFNSQVAQVQAASAQLQKKGTDLLNEFKKAHGIPESEIWTVGQKGDTLVQVKIKQPDAASAKPETKK
jgi:hypothetical protein